MNPILIAQAGSNPGRTRLHNRQLVLQCVRERSQAGRAQIARATQLSTQAVSNIIAELTTEGLLRESGKHNSGRGQPAIQYSLCASAAVALGVEVRSDAIFSALVDLTGNLLSSERISITDSRPASVANIVKKMQTRALESATVSRQRLMGAGIVMPGPIGRVGLSDAGQSTLVGWEDTDAHALFSSTLDVPVVMELDSIAAVFAERVSGAATGLDSFAYIYFGTGIGMGVMSNGKVLRGAYGNAGELGHVVVERGGKLCACGNFGCLETYVSRFSLREHLSANNLNADLGELLDELYKADNQCLLDWLEQAKDPLSQAVGIIENLFDPQCIVLGGALPDSILTHLINAIALPAGSVSNRENRAVPRLIKGDFGRMTASLGGAAVIINDLFVPRIEAA